jgi:cathepsin L
VTLPAVLPPCHPRSSNATRPNFTPVAAFKGFAHVKKRDELALMWAVAKHGPVAVSLDASQPSFKFYSEGVYREPHCLTKKVRPGVAASWGGDSWLGEGWCGVGVQACKCSCA